MNQFQARTSLKQLQEDWRGVAGKNPAVLVDTTVLEALLSSSADWIPEGHSVVSALKEKLPLGKIPAEDSLVIAGQLYAAIPTRLTHEQAIAAMSAPERQEAMRRFQGQAYLWAQAVIQQVRRLQDGSQPASEHMSDGCLLAYALRATRRAARGCSLLAEIQRSEIEAALDRFNAACPDTKNLRDAVEHFDDYLLNLGQLQKKRPGPYRQAYQRSDSSTKVQVGELLIDADRAGQAATHLASVVIAGKDHLGLLPDDIASARQEP